MKTKQINVRLVGAAILPALGVSIATILVSKAVGLPENVGERIAEVLFFPVFLGACYAWRARFDRVPADSSVRL